MMIDMHAHWRPAEVADALRARTREPRIARNPDEARQTVLETPLAYHPDQFYEYSDLGADVLGFVVEAVNDVINVFDASGNSVLPDNTATNIVGGFPRNVNHAVDLNSFYGYAPAINRSTGVRAHRSESRPSQAVSGHAHERTSR